MKMKMNSKAFWITHIPCCKQLKEAIDSLPKNGQNVELVKKFDDCFRNTELSIEKKNEITNWLSLYYNYLYFANYANCHDKGDDDDDDDAV